MKAHIEMLTVRDDAPFEYGPSDQILKFQVNWKVDNHGMDVAHIDLMILRVHHDEF